MSAVLRRAASGPQTARHAGPLESFKEFPGHEDRTVSAVRFRPRILAGARSGRLVEVKASALVSDARSAQAPGTADVPGIEVRRPLAGSHTSRRSASSDSRCRLPWPAALTARRWQRHGVAIAAQPCDVPVSDDVAGPDACMSCPDWADGARLRGGSSDTRPRPSTVRSPLARSRLSRARPASAVCAVNNR